MEANCQVPVCIRKVLSQMFIFVTITMKCGVDMVALHSLVIPYQLGWRGSHHILYNWTMEIVLRPLEWPFDTHAVHEQDQADYIASSMA